MPAEELGVTPESSSSPLEEGTLMDGFPPSGTIGPGAVGICGVGASVKKTEKIVLQAANEKPGIPKRVSNPVGRHQFNREIYT